MKSALRANTCQDLRSNQRQISRNYQQRLLYNHVKASSSSCRRVKINSEGLLVRPNTVSLQNFYNELEFFQIGRKVLEEYMKDEGVLLEDESCTEILPENRILRSLWISFEYPSSSDIAKLVACWSIMFIFLSIFILCAETIPHQAAGIDSAEGGEVLQINRLYDGIEMACIIWFTFEITARFISCPEKVTFLKDFLNYIDVAAVLPFYLKEIVGSDSSDGFGIMNAFRLLRVCRIFKLARHLEFLQVLGRTVVATWRELLMILFFVIVSMVVFSGLTYHAEHDAQSDKFSSIPATFWFVIVTLTNVGYGDVVPKTPFGKLLGTVCALVGVLAIALPSPVIATRFKQFYNQERWKKKTENSTFTIVRRESSLSRKLLN
ncbi:Potassium voltage-gated channel subfamily A member 1 [Exaiptasia diaphana]|nr:Potassium voltage-gated channel subfamily A member 1 [Exaiptasia diaphana]